MGAVIGALVTVAAFQLFCKESQLGPRDGNEGGPRRLKKRLRTLQRLPRGRGDPHRGRRDPRRLQRRERVLRARHLRRRSEEHTSELSHVAISYAVFCLKKKKH